jgi:hypothetical protein
VRLFLPKKTRNGPAKPRGKVCPGAADRSDADEIDSLYREFGSALLLFAVSITGDRGHAQDAVHQVLLKMIEDQNLGQARNKKAYLLACVRNAVLNEILDGTAPYDDLKYKDLVEKNKAALRTLTRPTAFPTCDGVLDYDLGEEAPVEYARKALGLGRLNVLYAFHLLVAGDRDGTVRTLAAGLHFSKRRRERWVTLRCTVSKGPYGDALEGGGVKGCTGEGSLLHGSWQ